MSEPAPPDDRESAWRARAATRERPGFVALAILSASIVPLWTAFDRILEPGHARAFFELRVLDLVGSLLLLLAMRRAAGLLALRLAAAAEIVMTGALIAAMVAQVSGVHHAAYVAGFSLVFWGSAVAVAWPIAWQIGCDVLLLAFWIACEAMLPPVRTPAELLAPTFYLASAAIISVVSLHLARTAARRTFDSSFALEERNRELRTALAQLRDAHARLVESEKLSALGRLLAGLSHVINNPVNVIANNLEPLGDYLGILARIAEAGRAAAAADALWREADGDFVRDDASAALRDIETAVERIRTIHRELRAFVRGDAPSLVEGDLNEGLRATVGMLRRTLPQGIELVEEYGALPRFRFQPGQLNQVFLNLLQNAVDAVGQQGRVAVASRRDGDFVEVEVADDGPGVPPAAREHLFEPFFTTKGPHKGTGLGLATCYQIVERHGGSLRLDDAHAPGARFVVRLPCTTPAATGGGTEAA